MKYLLILFFNVVFLTKTNAQNEYVNWYFGNSIGLNFCNGLHISQVNQFSSTYSASATISNKVTGQLLFHTDGQTVYNSQFQVMQNGSGLKGSNECTQGALIVPEPGNDSIYYIFTPTLNYVYPDSLEYSIVNMKSDNGLGAVITKNNFLHFSCEQLTAVFNKAENFYWILSLDEDSFIEYKLDANGLNPIPVLYSTQVPFSAWIAMSSGFLKVSPDTKWLACTFSLPDSAALYNFN